MSQTLLEMAKDLVMAQIAAHRLAPDEMHAALQQTYASLQALNPTASFNSLSNVLVLKGVVTARSWLTEGTLQWSWDPCPLPPQVIEL
jgi:predicted transcriptional regulator